MGVDQHSQGTALELEQALGVLRTRWKIILVVVPSEGDISGCEWCNG